MFLGGLGEVGRNMFLFETKNDIIVIDCGVMFPEEEQLGIDLVLPDISYLRQNKHKLRAIFITHGHEDHIGGLPWLVGDLAPVKIFATKLTLGMIGAKLDERKLRSKVELIELEPDTDKTYKMGAFTVEPFRVCHSIPDSVGFAIDTPAGLVVHTSDFKLDPTPIDGRLTDFAKIRRFAERGVHLLISDCVHIETKGRTPSEAIIGKTYEEVFQRAPGRIFVATFASLIARIQQVIDVASRNGRRVCTLGRSLEQNTRVALELGFLTDPDRVLVEAREAALLPDDKIVYIVTGSQGEPMAVLSRIANGDHREVAVGAGDTVIVSSSPIPGNETSVYRIIDKLFRAGADVIYPARALVHVSGHAGREEIAEMMAAVKPTFVLPFHGEPRHMALFADVALENGILTENITFGGVGQVIEIAPDHVGVVGSIEAGYVYVDGLTVGAIGDVVIRDRQALSKDGVLMVVVSVDRQTGQIVAGPEIVTRGFVHAQESGELLKGLRSTLQKTLANYTDGNQTEDWGYLSRQLRDATGTFVYRETRRRPMILPMVMEV
ncbi:MAG TPA: ribonuclease J [Thermomicrobiales bacterium]|nr:ribonuclease J [Thermomicrobiales bacterium]